MTTQGTDLLIREFGPTPHRTPPGGWEDPGEPDRLVALDWPPDGSLYSVMLKIISVNRQGLLMDVSTIFGESKTNVSAAKIKTLPNQTAEIEVTIEVTDVAQLNAVELRAAVLRQACPVTGLGVSFIGLRFASPVEDTAVENNGTLCPTWCKKPHKRFSIPLLLYLSFSVLDLCLSFRHVLPAVYSFQQFPIQRFLLS